MIDLEQEDKRLINDAFNKLSELRPDGCFPSIMEVLTEFASDKNKVFNDLCNERLDRRIEELAQEKTNNINGVPIRTLIAKDILNTLIEKTYLKTDYNDMADTAVRLTDALLKALKKNECNK